MHFGGPRSQRFLHSSFSAFLTTDACGEDTTRMVGYGRFATPPANMSQIRMAASIKSIAAKKRSG